MNYSKTLQSFAGTSENNYVHLWGFISFCGCLIASVVQVITDKFQRSKRKNRKIFKFWREKKTKKKTDDKTENAVNKSWVWMKNKIEEISSSSRSLVVRVFCAIQFLKLIEAEILLRILSWIIVFILVCPITNRQLSWDYKSKKEKKPEFIAFLFRGKDEENRHTIQHHVDNNEF